MSISIDTSKRYAIIGAGESAMQFVKLSGCSDFECFTSDGGGEFLGKPVRALEAIIASHFDEVVIASQYVTEILDSHYSKLKHVGRLRWYDHFKGRLSDIDKSNYGTRSNHRVLHAIYDLSVNPPNYEIALFLVRAELRRRDLNLDSISLVIVQGQFAGGVSMRANLNYGNDTADWRVNNLLIPMSQLLRTCSQVHLVCRDRLLDYTDQEFVYPNANDVAGKFSSYAISPIATLAKAGHEVRLLESSNQARDYIRDYLSANKINKPFVALTLREYGYQSSRNTDMDIYARISKRAFELGCDVVVVRDIEAAFGEDLDWPGVKFCPAAVFNLPLRMALYEQAILNVSVSSGPSFGLMLMSRNIDFLMTHVWDNEHRNSSKAFLNENQGLPYGEQYEFSGPTQRMCWGNDSDDIIREFEALLEMKWTTT